MKNKDIEYDEYLVGLAVNWFAKYGVSVINENGEFKSFSEVIEELAKKI